MMPKGYVIIQMKLDKPKLMEQNATKIREIRDKYGGKRLVARGGKIVYTENTQEEYHPVVMEFPNVNAANSFFHDPEHQKIIKDLKTNNFGDGKVVIVEGVDE